VLEQKVHRPVAVLHLKRLVLAKVDLIGGPRFDRNLRFSIDN
jgi:hypothetical protein